MAILVINTGSPFSLASSDPTGGKSHSDAMTTRRGAAAAILLIVAECGVVECGVADSDNCARVAP